jgi:PAS domain S-box-containing protein
MLVIPGYKIIEELYSNVNTIVCRGQRELDKQLVILKILSKEYPTPIDLAKFKHQYEVTKNLNLVGVIKSYNIENYQNSIFIVLEDIGGQSLHQFMTSTKKIEVLDFLRIATKLVEAIGELHQSNIIHKDIKPENIIINPETRQVKITDFSIASLLSRENQTIKNPNLLEGTLVYMSPEQTGRMNRSIDYRTDFYSLGVTFYEMLTKQLPYQSSDAMELVHCHIAKQPVPPHHLNNEIPKALSDIVMKLMAKMAEERYQSAFGLKVDLEKCLTKLERSGQISSFIIGQQDLSNQLQIPQKLYGREAEAITLLNTFDRVSSGTTEMMLVAGYSGIGKSALVNEIHKPIVQQRGYFIDGKFDQFKRNIPYTSLIQAFQELVRQLLTESEQKIQTWKEKILVALGHNGEVIVDVIPEVELIIGKQPLVPQLGPAESQNRFNFVFQNFIRVFTNKDHPLVLFLDDLQWADSASLKLIQLLVTDPDSQYLLLIGAYRDNEVSPAHPLMMTLDEIQEANTTVNTISLQALAISDINQLIIDTLSCNTERAQPLAELVLNKTNGNPFFLTQILKSLYSENLLTFDLSVGCWQWHIEQIQDMGITDNVVELMVSKIQKLGENTQNVLKLAACIGNRFDLDVLCLVNEQSLSVTSDYLWVALQVGLILPLSDAYMITQVLDNVEDLAVSYKFLHDRVQQAAYALIPEDQKKEVHLKIGQLLWQSTPPDHLEEKIFDIINHLNIGAELFTLQDDKYELAKLNLIAANKAKLSNAFESALNYAIAGKNLLAEDCWTTKYQLSFELHRECAICHFLTGNIEVAEELFSITLSRTTTNIERANVCAEMELLYLSLGRHQEVINVIIKSLRDLEMDVPNETDTEGLLNSANKMRAQAFEIIGERKIADLIDLPDMTDKVSIAAFKHLGNLAPSAFFLNMNLYLWLGAKNLHLSVTKGNSPISAFGYSVCGLSTIISTGNIELAYELAKLGVEVSDKFNNITIKGSCYFHFCLINSWKKHFEIDAHYAKLGFQFAMDAGDYFFISWSAHARIRAMTLMGTPLAQLNAEVEKYVGTVKKANYENAAFLIAPQRMALTLQGLTNNKYSFSDDSFDETIFVQETTAFENKAPIANYYIYKIQSLYLLGNYTDAYALISEASKYVSEQWVEITEYYFYYSLVIAAVVNQLSHEDKEKYKKILDENQLKMKAWATTGSENFLHKYLLIAAEVARIDGNDMEAIDLYNRAIESAIDHKFIQNEALANELAAKFWLGKGQDKYAKTHMSKAYYGYQCWGAIRKVEDLENQYPQLIAQTSEKTFIKETLVTTTTNSIGSSGVMDLATVMKATQAISGEIVLDKLLAKLMKLVIENAGAQKGFLILSNSGNLRVEAAGEVNGEEVQLLQFMSIDIPQNLPMGIINYVERTKSDVVLSDATHEGIFTTDSYIRNNQPKSILCAPLLNQSQLIGILYLENNLTAGAFTHDRLEVLKILSGQAAISITNAKLYAEVKENQSRLNQFLDAMPVGVSVHEPNGQIYYANQVSQELLGINTLPEAETEKLPELYQVYRVGTNQLYPADQLPIARSLKGEPAKADDLELHQSNKIISLEVSTTPIFDETGKLVYAIAAFQDITERKQAEKLIAEYNHTLEEQVKERTAQLAQANQEITMLNDRLKVDNVRMSAELEVTKQLQQMILPTAAELEAIAGLDIVGYMEPADEVGGDYYDVLLADGVVTLGIGDVTGHGLESGILMVMTQTAVRTLQERGETDPVCFLDTLNRTLYKNLQRMNIDRNLTLAILNYANGKVSISGQHEEILIVRAGGSIERIDTINLGMPIALDDNIADFIDSTSIDLGPGDGIVLYTDGITEAKNMKRDQYGLDRLCAIVSQNWQQSAEDIKQAAIADVHKFIGEQKKFDDISLLILKRKI